MADQSTRDAAGDTLTYDERVEMLRLADDIAGAEIADFDTAQAQIITRALRLAAETAAPQPAPDAMREALDREEEVLLAEYHSGRLNGNRVIAAAFNRLRALSAPAPPADGTGETVLEESENLAGDMMQTVRLADGKEVVRPTPLATGAAELVAWQYETQLRTDETSREFWDKRVSFRRPDEKYGNRNIKPLYATPPVREDREVPPVKRIECVKMVGCLEVEAEPLWRLEIGGICADFETETGANNFRNAILSCPVQPGDRAALIRLAETHVGAWVNPGNADRELIPMVVRQDILDLVDAILSKSKSWQ